MPDRLTLRATLILVAIALGLAFAIGTLAGGSPAAKPTAKSGRGPVTSAPGARVELSLTAASTVPALRHPEQARARRVHAREPARIESASVEAAPKLAKAPVVRGAPISPTPTAAPRYIAPTPHRVAPTPVPKHKPEPTAISTPPDSGEFDTSGEP
jgi:hypothetical protein